MCHTKTCNKQVPVKNVQRGYHRGTAEWIVEDVQHLQRDQIVESNIFEIGGYKWKLALFRGYRNGHPPELIKIFLFSCNAYGVYSDISFDIVNRHMEDTPVKRKSKVACPFQIIERLFVTLEDFVGDHQTPQMELVVRVDLKNIREATLDEQRKSNLNRRTVNLEVIDRESISLQLNGRMGGGIVSPTLKRHSDVNSSSLVRLWAEQSADHRYWHCERGADGGVIVKGCLNAARILQRFEEVCDDSGGGYPWVTVFKEEKKSNETFQPICDDTILVFCLLCEEPHEDFAYLGYLLVCETMACRDLLMKAEGLAQLQEGEEYRAFHVAEAGLKDISDVNSTLAECGLHSGSVIALRRQSVNGNASEDSTHQRGEDGDEEGPLVDRQSSSSVTDDRTADNDLKTPSSKPNVKDTPSKDQLTHQEEAVENIGQYGSDDCAGLNPDFGRKEGGRSAAEVPAVPSPAGPRQSPEMEDSSFPKSSQLQMMNDSRPAAVVSSLLADQPTESEDVIDADTALKILEAVQLDMLPNLYKDLRETILREIQQVGSAVEGVRLVVDAISKEIYKASMIASIELEELLSNDDAHLWLNDKHGRKALMMTDEFVLDEPIFLLNVRHDYRMRVSLAHRHQGDAAKFRIKYISVKPSDGIELGLMISETKEPSEGNEVVAVFRIDQFHSPRLASGCPQFGQAEDKYISVAVTIGIETGSNGRARNHRSVFELKGRVLCRPMTGYDLGGIRHFERFASCTWRDAPQWLRDNARGAVFLATSMVASTAQTGPMTFFGILGSVIKNLFILPCFHLEHD